MGVQFTLGRIAEALGATLEGDPARVILGVAPLDAAGPEHVSFLSNARYTRAAADVFKIWDEPSESDDADERPIDGQICAGARADLVVLSGNPLLADPDRLRVEATIAQGVEVYRAPAPTHSKPAR